MTKKTISADWILTTDGLKARQTMVLNEQDVVTDLYPSQAPAQQHIPGILAPALVNAHCHLELSHLKGAIPQGTGMAGFVQRLQAIRNDYTDQVRATAIEAAMAELYQNGVAGIGDICNGAQTLAPKNAKPEMHCYNFCELFGLDPQNADLILENGLDLAQKFGTGASPTLHAPYSMSKRLRDLTCTHLSNLEAPFSIHLLESREERQLFEELEGPLMDFLRSMKLSFQPHTYASALDYVLEALPRDIPVLLVHCTEMTLEEFRRVAEGWAKAHFVLCPRANRYIHGRLPDAQMFSQVADRVCVGTDSLASNQSLDILEELKLLQFEQGISTEMLLQWGSSNGARALGFPMEKFQIEVGSRPILIQISALVAENAKFTPESTATRLTLEQLT